MTEPRTKPDHRQNTDIERGEPDPRVPARDRESDVERAEPEDEDRRVRPGEKRPERIMP
jgi:hypothetical protein